ncbi:hypothetical protein GCM10009797_06910 [Nocardioides hwasunensis]
MGVTRTPPLACINPTPWRRIMMNRIRTRIESKRNAVAMQAIYAWRPAPPRG